MGTLPRADGGLVAIAEFGDWMRPAIRSGCRASRTRGAPPGRYGTGWFDASVEGLDGSVPSAPVEDMAVLAWT